MFAFFGKEVESSLSPVAIYLFIAVIFWAVRLTANWAYNFKSFEYQDWRYVMLKEKTGRAYPLINFLGIHLFPTCVVNLCVLPAVIAYSQGVWICQCNLYYSESFCGNCSGTRRYSDA